MPNPLLTFDAKDALLIFLGLQFAASCAYVCGFGALWLCAHFGWWT